MTTATLARPKIRIEGLFADDVRPVDECELCDLVRGNIVTKVHWSSALSVCVDCLTCRIPLAVIRRHDSKVTDEEHEDIMNHALDIFGSDFNGVRMIPRKIKTHAHYHLIVKD